MKNLLFDIESTGLLRQNSQIHCIVIRDLDNLDADAMVFDTVKDNVIEGVKLLESADLLSGHNIQSYDLPLLHELFLDFSPDADILDTLILSRLFYPNIADRDFLYKPRDMPVKLYGRHSLESWGYRLGQHKGTFGKENDWKTYSEDMKLYCIQDTEVNLKVYELMLRRIQAYA